MNRCYCADFIYFEGNTDTCFVLISTTMVHATAFELDDVRERAREYALTDPASASSVRGWRGALSGSDELVGAETSGSNVSAFCNLTEISFIVSRNSQSRSLPKSGASPSMLLIPCSCGKIDLTVCSVFDCTCNCSARLWVSTSYSR